MNKSHYHYIDNLNKESDTLAQQDKLLLDPIISSLVSTDGAANLSHHKERLFQANKLTEPRNFNHQDWQWIAESASPVVLEIGAGKGKHAMQFANANPSKKIIAIERTVNKFEAFAKLALYESKDNLYPVHADAIPWCVHALPVRSVSQIFILYPNPERNNANQQWLNMPFFEFLLSRLVEGGTVTLASNIKKYIDIAEKEAIETWQLPTVRHKVALDSKRTHFEIKYLARGEMCEELVMNKPQGYVTRFD